MTNTRTRLLSGIATMLGLEHGHPASAYTWLEDYNTAQLQGMMAARQKNTPELFSKHGLYVM